MPHASRRWTACLATSLGLHLLAMNALAPSIRTASVEWPNAPLQWVDWTPPRALPESFATAPDRPRPSHTLRGRSFVPPDPVEQTPSEVASPAAMTVVPATEPSAPPQLPIADLLASARALAHEMAGREARPPDDGVSLADRPILPQLDRALRREPAGERRLGHGLVRIISASGRRYCLQAPPDFAAGGPVPMLSVPTTCP